MAKLLDLTTVKTASSDAFVYTPPPAAFGAARILVKPNLGYPVGPPATISNAVLQEVLQGLRRASPYGRILIIEGTCSPISAMEVFESRGIPDMLDAEMRVADAEDLIMQDFPNRLDKPVRYATMKAPAYIEEFDCKISIGAFKRTILNDKPLISASLKNLYGLFPRESYSSRSPHARGQLHRPSVGEILQDVYFTVGLHFDGAVVDLTQKYLSPDWRPDRQRGVAHPVGKVVWGDDLIAVDSAACRVAGEAEADYLAPIRKLKQQLL